MEEKLEKTTLAGGCFWCTEAVFRRLKGVIKVTPGYSGGNLKNPTYEQVSLGNTGHAEAIQIEFDPKIISFVKLLDVFWSVHDPTTLNWQGNDVGPQYRSVIFYHSPKQEKGAVFSKEKLEKSGKYKVPIVTEIIEFTSFYPAEESHKEYYEKNSENVYCQLVIDPKIKKLYREFKVDLK